MSGGSITGEQAEAARKLLGWPRTKLSRLVGVSELVIANFEHKGYLSSTLRRNRLRKVFEDAGIEFREGEPPRLRIVEASQSEKRQNS